MPDKKANRILILLTIVTIVLAVFTYPLLPEQVASHWNADGQVNGYMSRGWAVAMAPIIMLVLLVLHFIIPRIDPMKQNIAEFKPQFNRFWVGLFVFFFYVFSLTLLWNLGVHFDFGYALVPAMALLFYFLGEFIEKSKRNFFMGIRTPWTLSSDTVWGKTQSLGGKMFKLSGILTLLGGMISGRVAFAVMIASVITSVIVSTVYSYLVFKKENK